MTNLVIRSTHSGHDAYSVDIDPQTAGWGYTGLQVVTLAAGESVAFSTGDYEYLVLPLEGGASVVVNDERIDVAGRATIWGEVTDYVFAGRGSRVEVTSAAGGRYALPFAVATTDRDTRYCPADEAVVQLRGAQNCSRQVTNYALNNAVDTDRMLVCEVLTPAGNWSSYPPHKHDEDTDDECALEEIYYFEVRGDDHGPGMGFHSTYGTDERPIEVCERITTGDVALVPHGWHGPCVAAPGYDLYYLNVMAGPGDAVWKSVDDPCYGWVRQTWDDAEVDPRLPMTPHV